MQDYPAAHSMDTEWFAVDASGNLALFDSGEGGAVPQSNNKIWQGARIDGLDSFLIEMSKNDDRRLISLKIPGDAVAKNLKLKELQNGTNEAVVSAGKVIGTQYNLNNGMVKPITLPSLAEQTLWEWFLLLSSDDVIAQLEIEQIDDNYAVRFAGELPVIYVKNCRVLTLQRLIKDGQVLAGKEVQDYREVATMFGFFVYIQDSQAPLPYQCRGKPIVPLLLEDLPEHLQDLISWTWFDRLQFSESNIIQPIEYMSCKTWTQSKWWVDSQGNEHEKHPRYGSS